MRDSQCAIHTVAEHSVLYRHSIINSQLAGGLLGRFTDAWDPAASGLNRALNHKLCGVRIKFILTPTTGG